MPIRSSVASVVGVLSAVAALLVAADARAWCRSTVCDGVDACDGEEIDGCPPIRWTSGCVGYSVSQLGGSGIDAATVDDVAKQAFDQWRAVDCGGKGPGVVIQNLGEVACNAVEYNKHAANANIVLFNDDWPHKQMTHTYALTTTTFDPDTGDLFNADIELNSKDHHFTVGDDAVEADLASVLTHETGHFLGMAHSLETDATMFAFYEDGSTDLRTLTDDDVAGLCAIYPPRDDLDDTCNPLPKHGFSPDCRDDQKEGDCTVADAGAGEAQGGRLWALLGVTGGAIAMARRRR